MLIYRIFPFEVYYRINLLVNNTKLLADLRLKVREIGQSQADDTAECFWFWMITCVCESYLGAESSILKSYGTFAAPLMTKAGSFIWFLFIS